MRGNPAFDLDWNLVRTFFAVAQAGSLAGGAKNLGITHPTAARHIQALEEGLGNTLFTRTSRGLALNDLGEALATAASDMHDSALAFRSKLETELETPPGIVRVAVSEALAEVVPGVLRRCVESAFAADGSVDVRLEILVDDELANLLHREADIAVRHAQPEQQELLCKRVGSLDMGAYATAAYLEKFGDVCTTELAAHRFVDGLSRDYLIRGARRHNIPIGPGQIALRTDSAAALRAAIDAGWGIGVVPKCIGETKPDWHHVMRDAPMVEMQVWLAARPEVRSNLFLRQIFSHFGEALKLTL